MVDHFSPAFEEKFQVEDFITLRAHLALEGDYTKDGSFKKVVLIQFWSKEGIYHFKNVYWSIKLIFFQNLITKAEEAPNKEVKCWFHPACFIFIIFGFLSQLLWLIFWSFTNYHRYPKFSARADRTSPERQGKARARENIGP